MSDERREINAVSEKKNFKQKLFDAFIPEDVSNVGTYILTDWILPGVWNFIQSGVNSLLPKTKGPGPVGPSFTGRPTKVANISKQFSYNQVYDQKNARVMNDVGDYTSIMIPDRADAEFLLEEMRDIIGDPEYGGDGKVSIGWFFDRCNIRPIPAEAWNWGWRDLRYAHVERYNNGYRIALPKAISLR